MRRLALLLLLFTAPLYGQATIERVEGVLVSWPAVTNATSYDVWKSDSTVPGKFEHIPTKNASITDFQILPGRTYTYAVATVRDKVFNEVIYTVQITIPPQPDIQITLKQGGKIKTVPISRRKGDTSTTAPITVNKSTKIDVITK